MNSWGRQLGAFSWNIYIYMYKYRLGLWVQFYVCLSVHLRWHICVLSNNSFVRMIIWHYYTDEYYYERLRRETLFMLSSSLINTLIYLRGGQLLNCRTEMPPRSSVPCSATLMLTASHKIYHYIYWSGLQHRMGKVRSLWLPTTWIEIEFPYRWGGMQKHLNTYILLRQGVDYIWWMPLLTDSVKGIITTLSSVTTVLWHI